MQEKYITDPPKGIPFGGSVAIGHYTLYFLQIQPILEIKGKNSGVTAPKSAGRGTLPKCIHFGGSVARKGTGKNQKKRVF